MESIYQFRSLNKYFIDDLTFEILTYLYGTLEYQRYKNLIDSLIEVSRARSDAGFDLVNIYIEDKDDSNLAGLARYKFVSITDILISLLNRGRNFSDYPLLLEEFFKSNLTDDNFIVITNDVFNTDVGTIEKAMKFWKDELSPDDYEKLVQNRKK